MVVIADLVARVRSEGITEATTNIKAVGAEAAQTTRALEIMAQQFAKNFGGTSADALDMFKRTGAAPTAAAMAEAAKEAEKAGAAVAAAVPHHQAAAKAANDHAKAAGEVSKGWTASESSIVRFGAGVLGVGLGLSLVTTAAKLVHDTIVGTVNASLDWERSLKNLSGLYGEASAKAAALATAQSGLPGVLGDQQEFAQAAINASPLALRYGLPQRLVDQLTTTGGRLAFATGMRDASERAQLQAQLVAAVTTGAALPPQYGIYTDAESTARQLGLTGAASLGAFTPQETMQARTANIISQGAQFADRANANQRALADAATAAEKAVEQARTALQATLENGGAASRQPPLGTFGSEFAYIPPPAEDNYGRNADVQDAAARNLAAVQEAADRNLADAQNAYAQALADSTKAQEYARMTTDQLTRSVDFAGAKLLSFFGSLEDPTSIAHGDILAQAQGAVSARSRSAIPVQGMGAAEIGALALGTTWQQAWQNFTASLAQDEQTNVIRRNLDAQAGTGYPIGAEGPGLDPRQRTAAQRAIDQAGALEPVNRGIGQANTRAAQADITAAETQANLERITLTQRERGLALMRETVDLRRLDVQQQQMGLAATQNVIRAQQAGLPAQYALSDAQYQTGRAAVLAQARLARTLQGKDVSGLPSIEDLVQMNVQGQFATAEAGPAAFEANRAAELAQRPATAAGLAQQLTSSQLTNAQLSVDLKNLGDLPEQTALELELVQNNRSQLSVQTELREYMKQLVYIMSNGGSSGGPPSMVPADAGDRGSTASSQLAGARR